jgi:hypothetical protein
MVLSLANPTGADGAAQGWPDLRTAKPTPENMMKPMTEGEYAATIVNGSLLLAEAG